MIGRALTTTANYADSQIEVGQEVEFTINTDVISFIQTARINPKDKSLQWDQADIPLPACDIRLANIAGIRFKTNGQQAASVVCIWTFPKDDIQVVSFSSNA